MSLSWLRKDEIIPISNKPFAKVRKSMYVSGWRKKDTFRRFRYAVEEKQRFGSVLKVLREQLRIIKRRTTQRVINQTHELLPFVESQQRLLRSVRKEQNKVFQLSDNLIRFVRGRTAAAEKRKKISFLPKLVKSKKVGLLRSLFNSKAAAKERFRKTVLKLQKVFKCVLRLTELAKKLNSLLVFDSLSSVGQGRLVGVRAECWKQLKKTYTQLTKTWSTVYQDLLCSDVFLSVDEHENSLDKRWLNINRPPLDDIPAWRRAYGSKRHSLRYLSKNPYPMRSRFVSDAVVFWFNYMKKPILGLNGWESRTKKLIEFFNKLKKAGGARANILVQSSMPQKSKVVLLNLEKLFFLKGWWFSFGLRFGLREVVAQCMIQTLLRCLHGTLSLNFIGWRQTKNRQVVFKKVGFSFWLVVWRCLAVSLSWFFKKQDVFKQRVFKKTSWCLSFKNNFVRKFGFKYNKELTSKKCVKKGKITEKQA